MTQVMEFHRKLGRQKKHNAILGVLVIRWFLQNSYTICEYI